VRWKRAIPWVLLICEYIVLIYVYGMLLMAGISAGFVWWPIPATLAVALLFTAGCVFSAWYLGLAKRRILWTISLLPAALLSFFIAEYSWAMAHPVKQTWIIPDGYHGPIYVVRGIPKGATAYLDRYNMVFVIDDAGIAAVREPIDVGWVQATYEYRSSTGVITKIPEAAIGSIEDTPANRQDKTRRIYFPATGEFGDGSNCMYKVNEAYVESPSEALDERSSLQQVGKEQTDILEEVKRRYTGSCSAAK